MMHINFYQSIVSLMVAKESWFCLLGVLIVEIAVGVINDWGSVNVYILSYIHYRSPQITISSSTSSILAIAALVPTFTVILLTNKVNDLLGYERVIRLCAIMYVLSALVAYLHFNAYTMMIFCFMIPVISYGLATVAIFHCLYTHFLEHKNKATAFIVVTFGLGAVLWNTFMTLNINPSNSLPTVSNYNGEKIFFSEQIANRVPQTCLIVAGVGGIMFVIGSWMITAKTTSTSLDNVENNNYSELIEETYHQSPFTKKVVASGQDQVREGVQGHDEVAQGQLQGAQQNASQIPEEQASYYLHPKFLILCAIALMGGIYHVIVQMNMKIIYLPVLNDDHFISSGMTAIIITGLIGSIFWGFLGDRFGPFAMILFYTAVDLLIKLFVSFAKTKPHFMAAMILLGFTDKAMLTLFGPALIQSFGLKQATRLLPFKFVTVIFGILFASLFMFVLSEMENTKLLLIITTFSFINIMLGARIWKLHKSNENDNITIN